MIRDESSLKLRSMSGPDLPKPDKTWSENALKTNQELMKLILAMGERIDELERQLKLNFKTSSKPPSTDRTRRPTKKNGRREGKRVIRRASEACLSHTR